MPAQGPQPQGCASLKRSSVPAEGDQVQNSKHFDGSWKTEKVYSVVSIT